MDYSEIAEEIIELKNADFEVRNRLVQNEQLGEGYNQEMESMHNRNAEALNKIIDEFGFPSIEMVGEKASEAAWLVIQHSISKPDFMKKCAKLLANVITEDKAKPKKLAYLTDRIAVYEGKPQLYGSQFDWNENGELHPQAFDELTKVNQRRKSIGLNTLEEQTEIIRKQAENENHSPPIDFEKKKLAFEKWKKKVGWIK